MATNIYIRTRSGYGVRIFGRFHPLDASVHNAPCTRAILPFPPLPLLFPNLGVIGLGRLFYVMM